MWQLILVLMVLLYGKLICYLFFFQSAAVNRLAAAHRGALRALQVVINQLSDLSHSKLPPHYKELGQLIRQLSLCSAKVEVDQGSAVPETALDILQKLEVMSTKCSQKVFARLYVFSLLWLYFSSDDLKCGNNYCMKDSLYTVPPVLGQYSRFIILDITKAKTYLAIEHTVQVEITQTLVWL